MTERWEPTYSETLPWTINLLSVVDDQEGFRVLLQERDTLFVYVVLANPVFYR